MATNIGYKYRLKEWLDSLSHQEYKSVTKNAPKALQISPRTFYRYINTRIDDSYSMPVDHLARLARFFGCRIEELLNYDPPPLCFKELKYTENQDIAKKLKLVK
jgi:hypothetical protein